MSIIEQALQEARDASRDPLREAALARAVNAVAALARGQDDAALGAAVAAPSDVEVLYRMLSAPEDCPATIGTLAGAGTAAGFPLLIEIAAPLAAGPVNVNCNGTAAPPGTVEDADPSAGGAALLGFGWIVEAQTN